MKKDKIEDEVIAFDKLLVKVLGISKEEMQRREVEYRKQVDANPNRRGPKRKLKPSASRVPDDV